MVSLAARQVAHKEVCMMKRRSLGHGYVACRALPGCQKEAGPAERAGKDVDKAGDSIQDAAKGDKK